jgi:predicted  nucleic acid-binding Zn-ribbon protein
MAEQEKQNRNTLTLLLLLLITSIGVNIYQWKTHSTEIVKHGTQVDSLMNNNAEIDRELASVGMELEKYRGIAGNLDTLLNDAKDKIALQEQKIRNMMASEKDKSKLNAKLKVELENLRKLRDEYLEQIDSLMAENQKLKNENAGLNSTVTNLNEQKNLLEGKVATASQLKVEYVKIASFKKRGNGKYTESVLAKRTNKLESCFTLMDNKVAGAGDKMIYLVITEPTGKTLMGYTKAQFTDAEGKQVDATSSIKVTYTGEKQNLCLAFENDERILAPGTYIINVYAENVLVHQSNYILK